MSTTLQDRLQFARETKPTPGEPKPRTVHTPRPIKAAPVPVDKPAEHRERENKPGTTGYSFPPRHGAKRRAKDRANQEQKRLTGKGPAKTPKG